MSEAFVQQCREAAMGFLQTVIIIDDGLTVGAEPSSSPPKKASRRSGSLLEDESVISGAGGPQAASVESHATSMAHPLNALELTSAFFDKELVAGLYKPTVESIQRGIIEHSVAMAKKCDAVIIDWSLEEPNETGSPKGDTKAEPSHLATEIIVKLVADDYQNGGRLRTIIVYTAEKDLIGIRNQLLQNLCAANIPDFLTQNEIEFQADGDFNIVSPNLRIAFYSKPNGATVEAERKKQVSDLPGVVIEEFISHVTGLLPSFALRSTAAVRRNTHHLLTRFPAELDTSYLAHRAMLSDAEDAEPFMLENLISVIRNTISLEQIDRKCLGKNSISNWADYATAKGETFNGLCAGINISCTPEDLKPALLDGGEELRSLFATKTKKSAKGDRPLQEMARIIAAKPVDQLERFSVLSSFKRSHADIGWASPEHTPYLTQGTIIAKVLANNEFEYLLCVTPKCDCVRIGESCTPTPRTFSFAKLEAKEKNDRCDLIVNFNGEHISLATQSKFHKLIHIYFVSNCDSSRVEGIYKEPTKRFYFNDVNECEYLWVGDLKDLHIQNRVSSLVGDLNRVGFDEFEWLRIRAKP